MQSSFAGLGGVERLRSWCARPLVVGATVAWGGVTKPAARAPQAMPEVGGGISVS